MSNEVKQPNEVNPPASQENPVDVQAFRVPEIEIEKYIVEPKPRPDSNAELAPQAGKELTRFGKLARWIKTPEKWATPNTCMAYLEGIRSGNQLDPDLAFEYLRSLEIWALAQMKNTGWRLREGTLWDWLPVIHDLIYKHLTKAPGGPSQRIRAQMEDPELWAKRKSKYRYRPEPYSKKLLAQLQRVYEKDLLEQGKKDFIKREAARLYDKPNQSWERLLYACGLPQEYVCYGDRFAPEDPRSHEKWFGWIMMHPKAHAPNPEDTFDVDPHKSNINAFYDDFLIKLLFDDKKTIAQIADAMGISVRSVLHLRAESQSKKVLDYVADKCTTMDMNQAEALSMWLDFRLKQIRKTARLAAFHTAEPARRK